jgi:hypothetical protein
MRPTLRKIRLVKPPPTAKEEEEKYLAFRNAELKRKQQDASRWYKPHYSGWYTSFHI